MNLLRTGRNITIIALILSLFFHASTVFYIFLQKTHKDLFSETKQNPINNLLEQQQEQKKHTPWVETKAHAGNFGAPVFFEDEPEEQSDDILKDEEISITPEETQEQQLENNIPNTQQDHYEVETPPQAEERKPAATEMLNVNPVEKPIQKASLVKNTQSQTPPRITKPKAPSKKVSTSQKNPFINYPTPQNHPKPPITLAQLTQGFLNQRKEQSGSYGISMLGMKRGIPSDEQMKYERYLQKLSWCLQNSFNINERKTPRMSADTEIHLFFSLNRDGILQQLTLKKSSGSKLLDDFVTFVFQEASQSFPPVPSYLPDNPFQLTCIIPIKIKIY